VQLEGKVCLITGSARGIGFAVAERFAGEGATIVLSDILDDALGESVKKLTDKGSRAIGLKADVSSGDQVNLLMERTVEEFERLDVLVNNAGITRDTLMIRMSDDDWDMVLNVNLKGAFLATRSAAKVMMKQRSGKIINVSSVVGQIGNAGQANYSASKAGLLGLTKTAARELAGRGICVNAIAPGFIETEMTEKMSDTAKEAFLDNIPLKRAGQPSDIASTALFLASPASDYITGQVIAVNGGLHM
jgi:3-oxoacyl-[acyl-carrier protein] reductase